jgi:signal transduction histidine kinase
VERGIADLDGIARIFRALLRIAEAEAGARRAAFATFDLVPVLADAGEIYEAAAEARGQRLSTELPEKLGTVRRPRPAAASGGEPARQRHQVHPARRRGAAFRRRRRHRRSGIEVAVEDDGPGMPPADRERAGQRFFRADEARATPGSGLGLALVQAVAGLHAGELVLEDADPDRTPPGCGWCSACRPHE